MSVLYEILSSLTNRELALVLWIAVFLVFILCHHKTRGAVGELIQELLNFHFVIVFALMGSYLSGLVFGLNSIADFGISQYKQTLFWTLSVGIGLLFRVTKFGRSEDFRAIIFNSFRHTLLIEFIVNLHSFSIWTELTLLPCLVFLAIIVAYSESKEEYKAVFKVFNLIFNWVLILIFIIALYYLVVDFQTAITYSSLIDMVLPSVLTVCFLPFVYLLALYITYESYFIYLDFMTKEKERVKQLKRAILLHANFNIDKLINIKKNFSKKAIYDGTDLNIYVKNLSKAKLSTNSTR